jgi:GAF domain-containing protein
MIMSNNKSTKLWGSKNNGGIKMMEYLSDIELAVKGIVDMMPVQAGAGSSEITLYDDSGKTFLYVASTGQNDRIFAGRVYRVTKDDRSKILSQRVMESCMPLVINDVKAERMCNADRDIARRLRISSMVILPMFSSGRFLGTISFDYIDRRHRFHKLEVDELSALADYAASMIDVVLRSSGRTMGMSLKI